VKKDKRFVGLDVHGETIAVAVAEPDGTVRSLGTIPNREGFLRGLVKKLGSREDLRFCYEAGPCGYVVYWQLVGMEVSCEVVAPTLVPVKPGDRVKTDRRDAEKLARSYRSGDLTAVWVPDAEHEALRDVGRAREAAKRDQLRARHRLGKMLLRQGRRPPEAVKAWTSKHSQWLRGLHFERPAQEATFLDYLHEVDHMGERVQRLEHAIDRAVEAVPVQMREVIEALQALRGVSKLTAVTVVTEVGNLSRFSRPSQLMGYTGLVSSEHSSGGKTRRGAITKTGNAHLRRVLVEAAWSARYRPNLSPALKKRQKDLSEEVKAIAWKAQHRLYERHRRLTSSGKAPQQVVTALARELVGFLWDIGVRVERGIATRKAAA